MSTPQHQPAFRIIGDAEPSDEFVAALARLLLSLVDQAEDEPTEPKPKPKEQRRGEH